MITKKAFKKAVDMIVAQKGGHARKSCKKFKMLKNLRDFCCQILSELIDTLFQ